MVNEFKVLGEVIQTLLPLWYSKTPKENLKLKKMNWLPSVWDHVTIALHVDGKVPSPLLLYTPADFQIRNIILCLIILKLELLATL